jgi:hypothetical protein
MYVHTYQLIYDIDALRTHISVSLCLYTISLRNIPLLYYCTEYGIFRYHVKAWTRLSCESVDSIFGTRFDKRWRLGAAYKRRIHFHVT